MTVQSGQNFPSLNQVAAIPVDTGGSTVASTLVSFGTVTLNESTPVTVANPAVTAHSIIIFTLKTVGGTVGTPPQIETITPGTGFTVEGGSSDTSTYNYVILG
jgi:hypothetical protein